MTDPRAAELVRRLDLLERSSRRLEPNAAERAALARKVLEHAERAIEHFETGPAYRDPVPADAAALDEASIGRAAVGFERALELHARHVDGIGHNTSAPGFYGYIPGGNLYHAALADFLAAASNRFSGRLVAGPGAVRIENQILRWLYSVVGYPASAGGNLSSGGSLANLGAIVAARQAAGLKSRDVERAVIYLTAHAHHCVDKACLIAGLGEAVVRRVPVDERFRLRPDALNAMIAEDRASGWRPFLVVATAGTTDTGAVDPLDAVAEIAARERIWFHVDAAYGGLFALCAEGREALRGLEKSDSLVLDPHKGLLVPFGCGALLVRDGAALRRANSFEANYISDHGPDAEEPSPMDCSLELSRPFRALRLWLPLQALGVEPFAAALEERMLLARHAYDLFGTLPGIEMGPPPDLSIFVFRFRPSRGDGDADAFNSALEHALMRDGRVLLSSTLLHGKRYLRFAVLSLRTHRPDVESAVEVVREAAVALDPNLGRTE
ncbi:MAG TPA: aminotransferase class V-fold PLP-dependent enzyme [Candidatus Eisenbacteria bacterium]|nr:aminotransferase class V-fold PLP-dependent enzyme [Candidatus Eisenbacteria bacterium]